MNVKRDLFRRARKILPPEAILVSKTSRPPALADLIGLDTCVSIWRYCTKGSATRCTRPNPLREHVAAGRLGRKSGRGFFEYS